MAGPLAVTAFVLRTVPLKESDLIVDLLTKEGSLLTLIARGAVKSRKRFGGGVLEPCNQIDIRYQRARSADGLGYLNEASILNGFSRIRRSYECIDTALYFLKLVRKYAKEGALDNDAVYNLLGHSIKVLENYEPGDLIRLHFLVRLLQCQGILDLEPGWQIFAQTPMAHYGRLCEMSFDSGELKWSVHKLEGLVLESV